MHGLISMSKNFLERKKENDLPKSTESIANEEPRLRPALGMFLF